jgi:hypothetical protein
MEYDYSSNDYTVEKETDGHSTSHIYRHYRTTNRAPYIAILWEWRRPLGLRWQFDLEEEGRRFFKRRYVNEGLAINYMTGSIQTYETVKEYIADGELHLTGTARYILDSRTNARATLTYDYLHYHTKNRGSSSNDRDEITFQITGVLEYRLAIPTILTVELDYTDRNRENITTYAEQIDYRHYLLTVGVTHFLF